MRLVEAVNCFEELSSFCREVETVVQPQLNSRAALLIKLDVEATDQLFHLMEPRRHSFHANMFMLQPFGLDDDRDTVTTLVLWVTARD